MRRSLFLSLLFILCSLVNGHGYISDIYIDGYYWSGFSPYYDRINASHPVPRIAYSLLDNGPVYDVTSPNITCSYNPLPGRPAPLVAPASAGANVTMVYTPWPTNHFGAIVTYLAYCDNAENDCTRFDASEGEFFKIHQGGLFPNGTWVTKAFEADNSTWSINLPTDLRPGQYILRQEQVSLHAVSIYGAELYPNCIQINITGGDGQDLRPRGVKFPGGYRVDEPGLVFNTTVDGNLSYPFPGPPVYYDLMDAPSELDKDAPW